MWDKKMKIKEICTSITDGSHNPPQGISRSEYMMLSSKNIFDDSITLDDPRFLDKSDFAQEDKRTRIMPGDVLLTIVGTVGRCAVVPEMFPRFTLQRSVAVLHPKMDICSSRFLMYALRGKRSYIEARAKGVAQKGIYLGEVAEIDVNVPTMDEQEAIIIRMDSVVSIINKRRQQLSTLDDLIKARFVEMFVGKNYPLVSVDDLSLGKGEYGAQSASIDYDASRPRYVRITDINDDGTLNDDLVSSSNVGDDQQYKLSYGDFLFARMGATVGKTYAYKNGNLIYAGYLIRYKLNLDKVMPEYLYAYTRLEEYWNWVKLNQSGAAQPGINAKKYGSLQIPVPPLSEQKAFQSFVVQVDKSKDIIKKALEDSQMLFNSLLQEYFG